MPTILSKIVGSTFRDSRDRISALKPGDKLRVLREPNNRHDPNAVAIYLGLTKLGYVPRDTAKQLAPMLDRRPGSTCVASSHTWGGITINLAEQAECLT